MLVSSRDLGASNAGIATRLLSSSPPFRLLFSFPVFVNTKRLAKRAPDLPPARTLPALPVDDERWYDINEVLGRSRPVPGTCFRLRLRACKDEDTELTI